MNILRKEKIEILKIFSINKLLEYLIILLPLSLVFSKSAGEIITFFIILLFLSIMIYKKKINYLYNKFFIIFILWCLYILTLSLTSSNILLSLEATLFFLRFGILAFAVYYACNCNKNFIINIYKSLLMFFLIIFIDSIIQYLFGKNIFGYLYTENRVSSFFKDEKILGSYTSMFLSILLLITYYLIRQKKYYFYISITLIAFFLIILSNERAAFINFIIIITFFIYYISNNLRNFVYIFLSFLMILLISLYSNVNLKERIVDLTIKQITTIDYINNNQDFEKFNFVPSVYKYYYNSSYNMFLDHKYFGIGPKNFRYMCKKEKYYHDRSCSTHPHHRFLQLFTETGIIGATPFVLIFLFSLYKVSFVFINKHKFSFATYLFFLNILIYFNPLLPSGNLFGSNINLIFFFNLGLFFFMNSKYINDKI